MNPIETCCLLLAIPVGLVLTGYWLAARLPKLGAAERLAVAMLAGICVLLWTVSVVNLALPLAGIWGTVCLLPAGLTFARRETRIALARDVVAVGGTRRGAAAAAAVIVFLAFLLWPLLTRAGLVFYDGTGSHDAFFWVTGAEHLKRQNYLQPPLADAVSPLYYSVVAITGWRPPWGRMGAEGLLALVSNLAGASPLKLYVAATAALFFPWVAAVYLVARTFVVDRLSLVAVIALVLLQPMFVFFHSNANLPNLVGALCGAVTVVATARVLASSDRRWPWLVLLALSAHGLLCSYPEMMPTIALPSGLLWARAWWVSGRAGARSAGEVIAAVVAALAMNPATTLRAWNGFRSSLEAVENPDRWPSIFATVAPAARPPAMATLSVPLGHDIGSTGGVVCCVILLAATVAAISRMRDRFGVAATLTGVGVMIAWTLETRFGYGWQKTMQFSAVFCAAVLPVGVIGSLTMSGERVIAAWWRRRAIAAGVGIVFAYATVANGFEAHKWSGRKFLTRDWFAARDYTRKALRNAPVLVETEAFPRPFFYTMWATYFLTESRVYFSDTDPNSGGYLQPSVRRDPPPWIPAPRAILVSSSWAAKNNLPRGWNSDTLAFLPGGAATARDGRGGPVQ